VTTGALFTAGISFGNWMFLVVALLAAGYFGHRSYKLYKILIRHSTLQNRAVALLQQHATEAQQLTSEE